MEQDTLRHLCKLSRLSYDEKEAPRLLAEMTDIIALMDTIRDFDLSYDDTKDNNSVSFGMVREDTAKPSFTADRLLSNAKSKDDCYVVPKVVD